MKWPRFHILSVTGFSVGKPSGRVPVLWYVADRAGTCPSRFFGFGERAQRDAKRECVSANAWHDAWLLKVLR